MNKDPLKRIQNQSTFIPEPEEISKGRDQFFIRFVNAVVSLFTDDFLLRVFRGLPVGFLCCVVTTIVTGKLNKFKHLHKYKYFTDSEACVSTKVKREDGSR